MPKQKSQTNQQKVKKQKKISNTEKYIIKHKDLILNGHVLCIDPSSGSQSSLPGYAIYKQGKITESGLITLKVSNRINNKLYEINRTLREEFDKPDLLILEYIPSIIYRGSNLNRNSVMSLHKSIGAIISSFDCQMLEIPAVFWRKFTSEGYVKSDENDAIMLGKSAVLTALKY